MITLEAQIALHNSFKDQASSEIERRAAVEIVDALTQVQNELKAYKKLCEELVADLSPEEDTYDEYFMHLHKAVIDTYDD